MEEGRIQLRTETVMRLSFVDLFNIWHFMSFGMTPLMLNELMQSRGWNTQLGIQRTFEI